MNFVLKTRKSALKMMNFAGGAYDCTDHEVISHAKNNDDFLVKHDDFVENDENDENDEFLLNKRWLNVS